MKTYSPKPAELTRDWLVIDAEGLVLGRVATVAVRREDPGLGHAQIRALSRLLGRVARVPRDGVVV